MTRDRIIFLISLAFIGLIAAILFSRGNTPPSKPPEGDTAKEQVVAAPEEPQKPNPLPVAPGKLAIPFQLTNRSAVVQFLRLGSIVDLIFTSKSDIGFGTMTFTLLNNLKVLDIGRDADGKTINDKASFYKPNTPVEILLEMTPKQAEILSYAQESGTFIVGIEGQEPSYENEELVEKLWHSDSNENFQSILITYMIRSLFPHSEVKVTATSKGYIISGYVKDFQTSQKIIQVLTLLASDKEKAVVNLMEELTPPTEILVAGRPLRANAPLTPSDYKWVKIDSANLNPSLVIREPQSEKWVNEFILSRDIPAGEPIKRGDIIWNEELEGRKGKEIEILPVTLGKTAIPFEIPSRSPIIQAISPGDYINVKFTSRPDIGLAPVNLILFRCVRILSIGKDPEGNPFNGRDHFHRPNMPIEIFIEMTPQEAEIFSYAQQSGIVSLELINDDPYEDKNDLIYDLLQSRSFGDFHSTLITYMIRNLFPYVCVKITSSPQGFIVEGKVPDPQMAAKIMEILIRVIPGGDRAVINLMDVDPQQVLLCVKVYEVSKDLRSRIGVNWSVLFQHGSQAFAFGAVYPSPAPADPNYFLGATGVFGNYTLSALLDMLQEEGVAKILAEPNLTTISGETGHFFSGGEFPILIPQSGGVLGTAVFTVLFKKFGISLDFTPTVDLNGLITLHIAPEVSNLDKENAVAISGYIIPSVVSRRVDTIVKLWPGQSYLIAGLYLNELLNRNDNLYGLNRIPLLGALFGSNRAEVRRTELLVIVTPYLIYDHNVSGSIYNTCPDGGIPPCDSPLNEEQPEVVTADSDQASTLEQITYEEQPLYDASTIRAACENTECSPAYKYTSSYEYQRTPPCNSEKVTYNYDCTSRPKCKKWRRRRGRR